MDMDVNDGMYQFIHQSIYWQMVYIMCRFVLQCVAVCCSVLQRVAVSTKLRISQNLTELQISPELTKLPVNLNACLVHTATHCSTLQHTTARCDTLRHTATHDFWAMPCNILQHTVIQCNTSSPLSHVEWIMFALCWNEFQSSEVCCSVL